MAPQPPEPTSGLSFEDVLAEILQQEEAGRTVDLHAYARRYPELASQLEEFFRDRAGFRRVTEPLALTASGGDGPAAAPEAALAVGGQFAGHEVLGELGRGGMGVVYKAWQVKAARTVALKVVLHGDLASGDHRARFGDEVRAAARLQH